MANKKSIALSCNKTLCFCLTALIGTLAQKAVACWPANQALSLPTIFFQWKRKASLQILDSCQKFQIPKPQQTNVSSHHQPSNINVSRVQSIIATTTEIKN